MPKLSDKTTVTTLAAGDLIPLIDIDDSNAVKNITKANLLADAGNKTYFADETGSTYNPSSPPAAPITTIVGIVSGDTIIERYSNAELKWSYDGSYTLVWAIEDNVPSAAIAVSALAFATAAEPTDAEAQTWIDTNGNDIVGQLYVYRGSAANPEFVWMDNGDDTIERIKTSIHETTNIFIGPSGSGHIVEFRENGGDVAGYLSHDSEFHIGESGVSTGKIFAHHASDGTVSFGGNTLDFSRASVNYLRATATNGSLIFATENVNVVYVKNNQDLTIYGTGSSQLFHTDYSAQRVGIGTNSPDAVLDISPLVTSDDALVIYNPAGGSGHAMRVYDPAGTEVFRMTNDGKIEGYAQGTDENIYLESYGVSDGTFIDMRRSDGVQLMTLDNVGDVQIRTYSGKDLLLYPAAKLWLRQTGGDGVEIGNANNQDGDYFLFIVNEGGATDNIVEIRGATSQTGLALMIEDSAESQVFGIDIAGSFGAFGVTPPSQQAYIATPTAAQIRDIFIAYGMMAAS